MLINWRITDSITDITLEQFVSEDETIYGFIMTTIFDPPLGYIPDAEIHLEGDSELVDWMQLLLRVGDAIKSKTNYMFRLLSFDMLAVNITCKEIIEISLTSLQDGTCVSYTQMAYDDGLNEVIKTVESFIKYIEKENFNFLESKKIKTIMTGLNELK